MLLFVILFVLIGVLIVEFEILLIILGLFFIFFVFLFMVLSWLDKFKLEGFGIIKNLRSLFGLKGC